tara:strand:+ start:1189 stop:1416 length:228 start_codon:yes stop_codon:yes gene_type:complete
MTTSEQEFIKRETKLRRMRYKMTPKDGGCVVLFKAQSTDDARSMAGRFAQSMGVQECVVEQSGKLTYEQAVEKSK